MILFFVGGAVAFAADTVNYVPPVVSNYPVAGGTNITVENGVQSLTPEQNVALQAVYAASGTTTGNVEVAKVSFSLPASGSVTITWANGQLLYNFVAEKFVDYSQRSRVSAASAGDVHALASGNYVFTKDSPFSDPKVTGATQASFLSVKGATQSRGDGGGGGGGGCSALTLGAAALFLAPAFALSKRGKK
jgi:hypothetical protein